MSKTALCLESNVFLAQSQFLQEDIHTELSKLLALLPLPDAPVPINFPLLLPMLQLKGMHLWIAELPLLSSKAA